MTRRRLVRLMRALVPGAVVLQFSGCFGGDPQFFITQSFVNGLVSFAIQQAFTFLTTAITAAT